MRRETSSFYHYNHLGTALALTGADEAVTDTYRHDAWGVLLASTGSTVNPHTYVGRERYYRMPHAEMYHLGFRDYAQGLGRFMTVDPRQEGPNWYTYSLNRTPSAVDPLGLKCGEWTQVSSEFVDVPDPNRSPEVGGRCVTWPPDMGRWVTYHYLVYNVHVHARKCSHTVRRIEAGRWVCETEEWIETNWIRSFVHRRSDRECVAPDRPPVWRDWPYLICTGLCRTICTGACRRYTSIPLPYCYAACMPPCVAGCLPTRSPASPQSGKGV
jgi:RHS repeat-associated protein